MLEDRKETLKRIVDAFHRELNITEVTDPDFLKRTTVHDFNLREISLRSDPECPNPPTAIMYDPRGWGTNIELAMLTMFSDEAAPTSSDLSFVEGPSSDWTPECQDEQEATLPPRPQKEFISKADAQAVLTRRWRQTQGENA